MKSTVSDCGYRSSTNTYIYTCIDVHRKSVHTTFVYIGFGDDMVRRVSYVGMVMVDSEMQRQKAAVDISTREVGRTTLVNL